MVAKRQPSTKQLSIFEKEAGLGRCPQCKLGVPVAAAMPGDDLLKELANVFR